MLPGLRLVTVSEGDQQTLWSRGRLKRSGQLLAENPGRTLGWRKIPQSSIIVYWLPHHVVYTSQLENMTAHSQHRHKYLHIIDGVYGYLRALYEIVPFMTRAIYTQYGSLLS